MTDSQLTHLALILDRSGSMAENNKYKAAEEGVRALVKEQMTVPGHLELTVVRFDSSEYELLALSLRADLFDTAHLRIEPRGGTPLFDAVAKTIIRIGEDLNRRPEHSRPSRVMILIATDGEENSSHEYSAETLRAMVERQKNAYQWEFIFMGTSDKAMYEAQAFGVSASAATMSSDTYAGVHSSYLMTSAGVATARSTNTAYTVTEEQRANLQ